MKYSVCQKSFYLWAGSSRHISTLGLQCLFPSRVSATLNGASFSHLASLKLTMVVSTWVISSTVCNQKIWKANCVLKIAISTLLETSNYNFLCQNWFDRVLTYIKFTLLKMINVGSIMKNDLKRSRKIDTVPAWLLPARTIFFT